VTGVQTCALPISSDCAGCHRAIHDGTFSREGITPEVAARFRAHVRHYLEVPSLDHLDGLVERAWIAEYLRRPHDLRPRLEETMPALPLGEEDARDLAAYLAPSAITARATVPTDEASIARGAAHFDRLGCGSCHALGAREPMAHDAPALAPDLAHVRERLVETAIAPFLLAPDAWRPGTSMPALVHDPIVARELAAFLVHGPLEPPPSPTPFARLAALDRPVSFDELEERVLRRSCWHCHADESLVYGDGGPGNTGGFGFAPREVDVSSYTHLLSGALDREGARTSLFRDVRGEPLLLRALLARHDEVRGVIDPDVRGMPLGLPPLDAEQIQLVESWIAQGRPR
jgi:mono/diheme cytochrome c family protein